MKIVIVLSSYNVKAYTPLSEAKEPDCGEMVVEKVPLFQTRRAGGRCTAICYVFHCSVVIWASANTNAVYLIPSCVKDADARTAC